MCVVMELKNRLNKFRLGKKIFQANLFRVPKVSGAVIFVDGHLVELPDHPMNHEENSQILQIQLNLTKT